MQTNQVLPRRMSGAHGEVGARADTSWAGSDGPVTGNIGAVRTGAATSHQTANHQGSVEPFRKPDHKAKRHSRPHRWADRKQRRERQSREWPE